MTYFDDRSRAALSLVVAAVMLAGCGSSQPPIGAPGTMPQSRRAHGQRAENARRVLATQTAAGNDPRGSREGNRERSEAIADSHRRNRRWTREHPDQRDEVGFTREIVPRLDAFSVAEISKATGTSLAACSRIRAGAKVPHPRHWSALAGLAGQ
jgi:hypothetical protein